MAFEAVCLKHTDQIKKGLGIDNIETTESAWRYIPAKGEKKSGAQINLLIDRKDHTINICEIKYYNGAFHIDKQYAAVLEQKLQVFREKTNTKKSLFLTIISTYGMNETSHAARLVQNNITMNSLFE